MIDFHSHVLPGIDDGSQSVEESLSLLEASAAQGVRLMCATPHFYPNEDDPERFLRHREHAWEKLRGAMDARHPKIMLGAEVYYFGGISRNDMIGDLRLGKTDLLLLEMPFSEWTDSMVREIVALNGRSGIRVMLAHIERYLKFQDRAVWDHLLANGVIMQSNADFFTAWSTRRKAQKMVLEGRVHVVSSDAHNMKTRPPKIGEALETVGDAARKILTDNAYAVLGIERRKK